jgi:hypothetical protein
LRLSKRECVCERVREWENERMREWKNERMRVWVCECVWWWWWWWWWWWSKRIQQKTNIEKISYIHVFSFGQFNQMREMFPFLFIEIFEKIRVCLVTITTKSDNILWTKFPANLHNLRDIGQEPNFVTVSNFVLQFRFNSLKIWTNWCYEWIDKNLL